MNYPSEQEHRNSKVLAVTFIALVALLVLPAGNYRVHGVTVRVSSFVPPFNDYAVLLATAMAVFVVLAVGIRLRGYRRRISPLSYVMASGGVLGFMVPDVITPGTRTVVIGTSKRVVSVNLLEGFWLTFAVAIILFVIASVAFFGERNASEQVNIH